MGEQCLLIHYSLRAGAKISYHFSIRSSGQLLNDLQIQTIESALPVL